LRPYTRSKRPEDLDKIGIALIELDFDRSKLLVNLRDRGDAIKNHKYEEKLKVEKGIEENVNREHLLRPMAAYVTFEYSHAVNLIVEMAENEESKGKDHMHVKEADMPSNIKWEDRNRTGSERRCHLFKTYVLIAVIMLIIFTLVFTIRYNVNRLVTPFKQI
jgi:uncharacterized protein YeeX (DUF496 family)